MQKKISPRISRLIRYFRSYTENYNLDKTETAKFGIINQENLYWNRIKQNAKKKISHRISR